jgi:hypothetical protein
MAPSGNFYRRNPELLSAAHIRASVQYERQHVIPDPIGLRDIKESATADVMEAIARRADDGRLPLRRTAVRWPKNFDPAAYRAVTHLDRLDQLAFRMQVGRCAATVETRLASTVLAHRFTFAGGAWASKGVLAGWRIRKDTLLPRFETDPSLWLATMDVRLYYPSLDNDTIARALNSFGVDTGVVEEVVGFLSQIQGLPGKVTGVPIGPEASSVLGTIGLVSIDRIARGTDYVRLADDLWCVASTDAAAIAWTDMIRSQLGVIGLVDNPTKLKILTGDDAIAQITDIELDYLTATGPASLAAGMAMLRSGIDDQILGRIRFGLGAIARHRSRLGAPILLANLNLLDVEPHAVTAHFRYAMPWLTPGERGTLIDHVLHAPGDHAIAGRLRTAHALATTSVNCSQADDLMAGALLMTERKHQPLRQHMILAACRGATPDRRIRAATDLAEATDDLDLRRTVADLNRRASSRREAKRAVAHLARLDQELALLARPLLATL